MNDGVRNRVWVGQGEQPSLSFCIVKQGVHDISVGMGGAGRTTQSFSLYTWP